VGSGSVTLKAAERGPLAVGENVIPMVQVAPPARAVPQVFEPMLKSPAFVPVIAMLERGIDALLALDTVTFCAAVVVPAWAVPKFSLAGLTVIAVPTPVSAAVCGLAGSESETLNAADRVPIAVGENVTLTVQLAPLAKEEPQVFELILKSAALAPVMAILEIEIEAEAEFETVTILAALVAPVGTIPKLRAPGFTPTLVPMPVSETV